MAASSHQITSGATSGAGLSQGFAHCQGRRTSMEDEIILGVPLADGVLLYGVLDGHGGRAVVERLVTWLPDALRAVLLDDASVWPRLTPERITEALQSVDERLLAASEAEGGWEDGSTALLAIACFDDDGPQRQWRPLQLVQLGDCQAALCGAMGAETLCAQHRVGEAAEDARLDACGATVEEGRVIGNGRGVAVTRALGDAPIKRAESSGLSAVPEVRMQPLSAADELLILGCDGLWDVMHAEDAWEVAKKAGRKRPGEWDLEAAATGLVQAALDRNTGDNVSVVLVSLKRPRGAKPNAAAGRAQASRLAPTAAKPGAQKLNVMLSPNGGIQRVELQP